MVVCTLRYKAYDIRNNAAIVAENRQKYIDSKTKWHKLNRDQTKKITLNQVVEHV